MVQYCSNVFSLPTRCRESGELICRKKSAPGLWLLIPIHEEELVLFSEYLKTSIMLVLVRE
jgi:hypothetical protein